MGGFLHPLEGRPGGLGAAAQWRWRGAVGVLQARAQADVGRRAGRHWKWEFNLCFKWLTCCVLYNFWKCQDSQGVMLPEGEVGSPRSVVEEAGSVL